jgi:ABC-type transport system involved in multi-copper enzyme maturation permease subunit
MAWRWGPGPVFWIELRAAARRWQTYAVRVGFILALMVALAVVWESKVGNHERLSVNQLASAGETFYYGLVGTQLTLILLAAPAATAGAVCIDKSRGCLLQVLTTDLSSAEIVLGKLAANLTPVFSLLLAGVPVLGAATLIGGIEPWTVFGALFICAGTAVFGCALALLLSVWAGRTHEVLVAAYAVEAAALLACPLWVIAAEIAGTPGASAPDWLRKANPYWLAFAPYSSPFSSDWVDPLLFFAGCAAVAATLTVLAVLAVRPAVIRYGTVTQRPPAARQRRRRLRLWPEPTLDWNPVLWMEWRRQQPSRWLRAIWLLFRVGALSLSAAAVGLNLLQFRINDDLIPVMNAFVVTFGLLLFSVSAVTSLADERVRGSLDVLMTTPLTTVSIVLAKWWGTFRTVILLALFVVVNLTLSLVFGSRFGVIRPVGLAAPGPGLNVRLVLTGYVSVLVLANGAAIASLGLALATWLPRMSRAAAWCAAAFVLMTVAPPLIGLQIIRREIGESVLLGSPFFGVGVISSYVTSRNPYQGGDLNRVVLPAIAWIVCYSLVAVALLVATLLTFDRCLGRARQRRSLQSRVVEYEAAVQ